MEAHHDVSHLYAGVIDIILHFDVASTAEQHAYERVAENRIAEVADVSGFIRVDIGMLDDGLARGGFGRLGGSAQNAIAVGAAVQTNVDIAVAGDFEGGD